MQVGVSSHRSTQSGLNSEELRTLAHDIRKPLGILGLLAQDLAKNVREDAKSINIASMMVNVANTTIQQLDAVMRSVDEPARADFWFEVAEALRAATVLVRDAHPRKNVRFVGLHRSGKMYGTPDSLVRAVQNLLDNALAASKEGEEVEVTIRRTSRELVISVLDRGCGIPWDSVERVMEPGYTTKRSVGGSGLGLPSAASALARLNGTLELRPRLGGGTRAQISIALPAS